jgi:hypothetical protein
MPQAREAGRVSLPVGVTSVHEPRIVHLEYPRATPGVDPDIAQQCGVHGTSEFPVALWRPGTHRSLLLMQGTRDIDVPGECSQLRTHRGFA